MNPTILGLSAQGFLIRFLHYVKPKVYIIWVHGLAKTLNRHGPIGTNTCLPVPEHSDQAWCRAVVFCDRCFRLRAEGLEFKV